MPGENRLQSEQHKLMHQSKRGIIQVIFGRSMLIALLLVIQFGVLFTALFSLSHYVPYLFGGVLVLTAVMELYILNTRGNPTVKLSWCIVVAVLPAFGALLYLYVQIDLGHRLEQKLIGHTVNESLTYVPEQPELMEKLRREDKDLYNLAHYIRANAGTPVGENTDVRYFPLGEDKFAEMLVQLEQAQRFIFMEYFAVGEGYMWNSILEILARKAGQGVEVRVMYDGTSALVSLPYNYPRELEKLGIRCKMFSPLRPFVSTHYNNRDHRKILVIDGHTAFTGGVNLEDRYINKEQVYGHWKDTAVMVKGDAARSFTLLFLQMWNATEKERVYEPYLQPVNYRSTGGGYVIPYGDGPMDTENVGEMVYLNILNQAKDYVYIMTPYLILDNEMVTSLRFAAKRGVDVRLILPHIPDKKYAFVLAKSHYKELIEAGVRIYEYTPGFLHAKVFLSDDRHGVVGTINLDFRSLYLHFECAAYLYRVPAMQDILTDFRDTLEKSQEITMEDVRKQGPLTKLSGAILKAAAPLM